ncbi:MAG: aminotransferase class I/II-fold pyridoxal phosphate-dependent enzyme, partial [Ruminococcus sp.]|nr:aminotransferase class I/II-fold pyridoxal phosphate-dependent enzyme [Ruminococcus sp.]
MVTSEHGGDIYRRQVLYDFSANVNPLGMPESARRAALSSELLWERYPDPLCGGLTERIAEHEGTDRENILCGCGAADIIYRIVNAVRPKKAVIAAPTFSEYERALRSAGCEIARYMLDGDNDFDLSPDFADIIDRNTDIVFLCTPNNPTG